MPPCSPIASTTIVYFQQRKASPTILKDFSPKIKHFKPENNMSPSYVANINFSAQPGWGCTIQQQVDMAQPGWGCTIQQTETAPQDVDAAQPGWGCTIQKTEVPAEVNMAQPGWGW